MRMRGFTLLELLVVVAVATILITVAVPGMAHFVQASRTTATVNDLVRALQLARTRAILDADTVSVCKSADGTQCGSDGTLWEDGWIVFVNRDRDTPARVDSGEPILLRHHKVAGAEEVRGNRAYFNFRPASIRSTNGTLTVCDPRGPGKGRAIVVSYTGRTRLKRGLDASGTPPCPG